MLTGEKYRDEHFDKNWLTCSELAIETEYSKGYICALVKRNEIQADKTALIGGHRFFHISVVEQLVERRKEYHKETSCPPDAIEYDGFVLSPDAILRLEEVRERNGYRAIHWTPFSPVELMAMAMMKQK